MSDSGSFPQVELALIGVQQPFVLQELERRFTIHKVYSEPDPLAALAKIGEEKLPASELEGFAPKESLHVFETRTLAHALLVGGPKPSAKIRAFVDFLVAELSRPVRGGSRRPTERATLRSVAYFCFAGPLIAQVTPNGSLSWP